MSHDERKALARYLPGASRAGLGEFYLKRLGSAANLERELREKLHLLADELAWVRYAELLREHGEEIVSELSPRRRRRA